LNENLKEGNNTMAKPSPSPDTIKKFLAIYVQILKKNLDFKAIADKAIKGLRGQERDRAMLKVMRSLRQRNALLNKAVREEAAKKGIR
jgi:hypothetical protein